MEQKLWVPGPMPGMNEILDAKTRAIGGWQGATGKYSKRHTLYNGLKKEWNEKIQRMISNQCVSPMGKAYITFYVIEPNRRRDPDNFTSGAIKFILDSLVHAKVLDGDGWKCVHGLASFWCVGDLPGVAVFIRDDRLLTEEECNHGQREVDLG